MACMRLPKKKQHAKIFAWLRDNYNFKCVFFFQILQDSLQDLSQQIIDKASGRDLDTLTEKDRQQMCYDMYRLYVIGNDLHGVASTKYSINVFSKIFICKVIVQALGLFEETKGAANEKKTRSVSKMFEKDSMVLFHNIREQLIRLLHERGSWLTTVDSLRQSLKYMWDLVLRIEIPSKSIETAFIGYVRDELKTKLQTGLYDVLLIVYCQCHNQFGSVVQDILSALAFKALEKGQIIPTYGYQTQEDAKRRYAELLSSVFETHWKGMTDDQMFQEAIKWTPFAHFLDMFYQADQHLGQESGLQLIKAISAVEDRMNQLKSGTILVKDHSVICANFEQFEKLIMLMMKKDKREMDPTYLRQLVDLRSKELQAFLEVYGLVTELINMCSRFEVDIVALERKHRSLQNIHDVPIAHLCTPGKLDNIMRPEDYRPVVAAFDLSPEELDLLPQMKHCSTSLVFTNKWDSTGHRMKRQKERKLSVSETFEHVWEQSITWWNTIKGKIKQGTMTFQEFDKIFGKHDCQIIETEFNLMEENGTWIKERMAQIQLFRDLENCVEGARIILQVVAAYGLNGDFKPIELITSVMKGTDIAMNALDQSLRQICSILGGVQEKHITCLREFINCEPLILWLKESMPSGLKELKVFVDLATISAGEGDIEIAKVRCLHSATTGYAPLIFNLNDEYRLQRLP
ncbi:E3 ubiquitin-protein ligase RNF213-like [Argopecten irradians]|uniref:E3 ubiquitin-protein ligase RNF213-like n=1 Tax=Argopecten irradians TaxID=31199 RepID=UPI00371E67BA